MAVAHGFSTMTQYFSLTSPTNSFIDKGYMTHSRRKLRMMTGYGLQTAVSMNNEIESFVSLKIIEATGSRSILLALSTCNPVTSQTFAKAMTFMPRRS